jgi:hypothetical protein
MMPEGWQPPSPVRSDIPSTTTTEIPPILATNELDDEEPDLLTPTVTPQAASTSPLTNSPRLRPRVEKSASVFQGKPPPVDTKRPSLPILQVNGPASAIPQGPLTATAAMPDDQKEGSSWGWFSNKSKTQKSK